MAKATSTRYADRWDDMSVATQHNVIPWTTKLDYVASYLRSKGICRLHAWGDSSNRGRCRFEYNDGVVRKLDKGSGPQVKQFLQLLSGIATTAVEAHAQALTDEDSFFREGRKRIDFNAYVDLRKEICIVVIAHSSAACGTVFRLVMSPKARA